MKTKEPEKRRFSVKMAPNESSFMQDVFVTVVDGKTHTRFDVGRDHWLGLENPLEVVDSWIRTYHFINGEIPKEYAFVLENDGLYYPPTDHFFIGYEAEEFLRICRLERDTNSEHALDGERCNYQRLDNAKPIERPLIDNEFQNEETPDPA